MTDLKIDEVVEATTVLWLDTFISLLHQTVWAETSVLTDIAGWQVGGFLVLYLGDAGQWLWGTASVVDLVVWTHDSWGRLERRVKPWYTVQFALYIRYTCIK